MTSELEREMPDLEDLAAYIDGRLSGARKSQVEERLLHDDEYHEVFLDAVRFQQKQAQDAGEVVRPAAGRWRRSWRVAVPLAAAAVVVVAVTIRSPDRTVAGWASRLDAQAVLAQGEDWDDPGWTRSRGPEDLPYRPQELAFRLGARSLHLRLALSAGDRETLDLEAGRLARLAREAELFLVPSLYEGLRDETVGIEALPARVGLAEKSCYEDGSPEKRLFLLGAWAEAGRLAALTGDAKALARVIRGRPTVLPEDGIDAQIRLLDAVEKSGDDRFERAASAFSEILSDLAG